MPAGTTTMGQAARTDSRTPKRVLYIEDNPVNAIIVQEALAREPGLVLQLAATGAEGLEKARQWRPQLVLLDMQLPDLDGLEVLAALRRQPELARTVVVAVSANALPDQMARARAAGVLDYWTKPLDLAAFVVQVRAVLGRQDAGPAA